MPFKRETPIALVHGLMRAYTRYGGDPEPALKKAQIPQHLLKDPKARVTSRQIELFAEMASRELNDEGFGMYSVRLAVGTFEMTTRACTSAQTLEEALLRWCRLRRLVLPDLSTELSSSGATATLSVLEHQNLGPARDLALLSVLRHVHGLACWWIDSRMPLVEVAMPGLPPPHKDALAVMFPGPLRFGAQRAQMRFSSAYLGLPVLRSEAATRHFVRNAVHPMIRQYRRDRLLVQRTRALLLAHLHAPLSAAQVAAQMHLSVRTLHRQLAAEESSLHLLRAEVLQQRATELLDRHELPIKRVATALGFTTDRSFARAFQRWTGVTPAQWRAQAHYTTR